MVKLGLDRLIENEYAQMKNMRVGLICNQATVNGRYEHAADLFYEHPEINLTALFGPQHGIRGDVQDNMIETVHGVDGRTGLPVYSLYSETREPTEKMLENVDALVFDLQDVGCRVYTFIYTMANAMRACAKFGKKMFVLDRPNPINGMDIEGNILERGQESFVGQFPIPMRHGMTIGELARMFNKHFEIRCDLTVVPMENWDRSRYLDEIDAPWVIPSPNMPTIETAVVFPGTVLFEGTKVSEGRGTTRPFHFVGAPYINAEDFADALKTHDLSGVVFQSINFLPTFQKHAGQTCGGVLIHVTDRKEFEPVITGIALVKTIYEMYGSDFDWKTPPYEYVYDRNPFDVIAGSEKIRKDIEAGKSIKDIKLSWSDGVKEFRTLRESFLLY